MKYTKRTTVMLRCAVQCRWKAGKTAVHTKLQTQFKINAKGERKLPLARSNSVLCTQTWSEAFCPEFGALWTLGDLFNWWKRNCGCQERLGTILLGERGCLRGSGSGASVRWTSNLELFRPLGSRVRTARLHPSLHFLCQLIHKARSMH